MSMGVSDEQLLLVEHDNPDRSGKDGDSKFVIFLRFDVEISPVIVI
jgi:hypothetical protein